MDTEKQIPVIELKDKLNIFVYGTLKPGECNYENYVKGKTILEIPCWTHGTLYDIPYGYPALIESGEKASGYLLVFNDLNYLPDIDSLEGYSEVNQPENNLYNRKIVNIYNLKNEVIAYAWAYFMSIDRAISLYGKPLLSDNWSAYNKNRFDHDKHFEFLNTLGPDQL